mmetsp:Transcript_12300/g.37001  ORF Transcript_12300/g.37001 Transcript_12300/m.37001 type:complete len:385 (+) Transcript_12300:1846-3000(+)
MFTVSSAMSRTSTGRHLTASQRMKRRSRAGSRNVSSQPRCSWSPEFTSGPSPAASPGPSCHHSLLQLLPHAKLLLRVKLPFKFVWQLAHVSHWLVASAGWLRSSKGLRRPRNEPLTDGEDADCVVDAGSERARTGTGWYGGKPVVTCSPAGPLAGLFNLAAGSSTTNAPLLRSLASVTVLPVLSPPAAVSSRGLAVGGAAPAVNAHSRVACCLSGWVAPRATPTWVSPPGSEKGLFTPGNTSTLSLLMVHRRGGCCRSGVAGRPGTDHGLVAVGVVGVIGGFKELSPPVPALACRTIKLLTSLVPECCLLKRPEVGGSEEHTGDMPSRESAPGEGPVASVGANASVKHMDELGETRPLQLVRPSSGRGEMSPLKIRPQAVSLSA